MRSGWFAYSVAALLFAGVALPVSAYGATCSGAYSSDQLVLDTQALESAVIAQDEKKAIEAATKVATQLGCAEQRLPLAFLGRVYRGIAGGYYVGGDRKTAESWYRTALEVDRGYRYGVEDLASDHPLRMVYNSMLQAKEEEAVAITGKVFNREGTWFLDGRPIAGPVARPGRPHLLQLEADGMVKTWLIEGNSFPADLLAEGKNLSDARQPKEKKERTKFDVDVHQMGQGAVLVDRSRPPEQIPLIVAGSGLLATSVGLYAGSWVSRQHFNTIRGKESELRASQQTTNRLVLGALATAAIGAGSLTYGIVIDDQGRPAGGRLNVRF